MAAKRKARVPTAGAAMRSAIEYADKYAGQDDKLFVEILNDRFQGERAPTNGRRTIAILAEPPPPTRSFQIYSDPRYLAYARALARRTRELAVR